MYTVFGGPKQNTGMSSNFNWQTDEEHIWNAMLIIINKWNENNICYIKVHNFV